MELSVEEIALYLRVKDHPLTPEVRARVEALRTDVLRRITPRRVWQRIRLPFWPESHALARHLLGCTSAYLVCGTLGTAFDAFLRRITVLSAADAFIVQALGAAAIEKWMDAVEDEIRQELAPDETLVSRFSPGYGDFPLTAQRTILTQLDTARQIGVSLTDTLLMAPAKSVSAIIGVHP